jgi:hypothetical protein
LTEEWSFKVGSQLKVNYVNARLFRGLKRHIKVLEASTVAGTSLYADFIIGKEINLSITDLIKTGILRPWYFADVFQSEFYICLLEGLNFDLSFGVLSLKSHLKFGNCYRRRRFLNYYLWFDFLGFDLRRFELCLLNILRFHFFKDSEA